MSWLRLLAKDRPGSDPLIAHWPQNDAFSHLVPGQNEMLREHANSMDNSSSSVVVVVVKNPNYKNNSAAHEHPIPTRLGTGP